MRVSARHALLMIATSVMALTAAPASAGGPPSDGGHGGGGHGCCTHGGGHTVNVPHVNIHGGNINVGVNIHSSVNVTANVNANVSAVANANAAANAGAGSSAGAGSITFVGGGSYYAPSTAPAATAITGLRVVEREYEEEYERVEIIEEWRMMRAVCLDDRGNPHPASQVDPEEEIPAIYDGEVYRCMAGTTLQVTVGWRLEGEAWWDEAQTIMCRRGEALWHSPGGELRCATPTPQRNCNERSLLRRYGPGEKVFYMRRTEVITEYERVAERESLNMTLMLDGGVGGYR